MNNKPRLRLTPDHISRIRTSIEDLVKTWGMTISSTVLDEHVKFVEVCWEFLGKHESIEDYIMKKSYILQRKIKTGYENVDFDKQETRDKIVSGEYLLGDLYDLDGTTKTYTILATKSSFQKVIMKLTQQLWESVSRPVNNGV